MYIWGWILLQFVKNSGGVNVFVFSSAEKDTKCFIRKFLTLLQDKLADAWLALDIYLTYNYRKSITKKWKMFYSVYQPELS